VKRHWGVLAAAVAALGLCADARADSLTRSGGVLTYTGDPTQSSSVTVGDFRGDVPAYLFDGHTVWGLTYRMIRGFLAALEEGAGEELR